MSVINFIMYGMKGVVIHMNALTLEIYGGYPGLFAHVWIVCLDQMTIDQCKYYTRVKRKEKEPTTIIPVQPAYIAELDSLFLK